MYMKTTDWSWHFAKMEAVNSAGNGVWSSNALVVPPTTSATRNV